MFVRLKGPLMLLLAHKKEQTRKKHMYKACSAAGSLTRPLWNLANLQWWTVSLASNFPADSRSCQLRLQTKQWRWGGRATRKRLNWKTARTEIRSFFKWETTAAAGAEISEDTDVAVGLITSSNVSAVTVWLRSNITAKVTTTFHQ